MIRLVYYIIAFALLIGVGEVGVRAVMDMAGLAAHAQQHDQISYSKWNRMLWLGTNIKSRKNISSLGIDTDSLHQQ